MSEIGAVLLAAGRSERFGAENKLLASLDDRPVVQHVAQTVLRASLADQLVVLGHEAQAVRSVLPKEFVTLTNDRYVEGQHTSVRAGATAAREAGWDGAVFVLGDMPFIAPETIDTLVGTFREGAGSIVVPTHEETRGNPVVFGADHFDALAEVRGDQGGRTLIESETGVVRVPVDDPGVRRDIDRPEDLPSFRQ